LFVTDLFLPLDDFAVELFLNGDMGHGRGWRGAMPMLLLRRAPDHITRSYFHFWTTFALYPATPRRDNQGLTERMGMPRRPGAGLERDTRATRARRIGCFEQGIDTHIAGEILGMSFGGGL
jgi:hypothetical protein